MKIYELINETATSGATSASSIATTPNPHITPGTARGNKSYTGVPGKSGTKSPPQPKPIQPKNADGTAKNAADLKDVSLFGTSLKR